MVSYSKTKDQEASKTDEDVFRGFQFFYSIVYCPVEDIKLFLFFDKLLSVERSRTITHTTVNLFHSDAIKDPRRFKMAKDFYLD